MDDLETFQQHRGMLFAIAYRMLGTVADAEDMVQETFLRWQQASAAGVQSQKSYLAAVVTRLSIDHLRSARVRREQYVGPWLPEPLAQTAADPLQQSELADSLSMAFLVLLESLSPLERAVFLLSEVFEYDHAEIARIVDKSPANCRQILRRARRHLAERQPRFRSSRPHSEKLVARFLQACSGGDLEGLLAVLAPEVTLVGDGGGKVAATIRPLQGAARVARFFVALRRRVGHFTLMPTVINGQSGIAFLVAGNLQSAMTFDITEAGIQTIYSVRNPEKLQRFAQSLGMPLPP